MQANVDRSKTVMVAVRLVSVAALLGLVAWAWASGVARDWTLQDIRAAVSALGSWGPVVYVVAFACLQPFGFSAHLFLVVAGLMWMLPTALTLGFLGMMSASGLAFFGARWLGRDVVQRFLPPKLLVWDQRLEQGGLGTVILIRLFFFTAFPVQLLLGVSRVSVRDYFLGTAIGNLPVLVVVVVFAGQVAQWLEG